MTATNSTLLHALAGRPPPTDGACACDLCVPTGVDVLRVGPWVRLDPPVEQAPPVASEGHRLVRVKCTFFVDVEVPSDWDDEVVEFVIEENNCPNTGPIGAAVDAVQRAHKAAGTCWACACGGANEIVPDLPPVVPPPAP